MGASRTIAWLHGDFLAQVTRSPLESRADLVESVSVPMSKTCFATVGTTQFDALISSLLSAEVLGLLASQGYTRLLLQIGRGAEPCLPASAPLEIEWYARAGAMQSLQPARLGPRLRTHVDQRRASHLTLPALRIAGIGRSRPLMGT